MWNNNYGYIDIINFINQTNWKIKWIEPIKETGELLFICEK
jgi:hypothetical protein